MRDDLFEELLQSVREGGAILRGEAAPAAQFSGGDPDVTRVREQYGLSQAKFAGLLGISVRTLQNWEQHRRKPEGPSRVLLQVAARHPEAVLDAVYNESKGTGKNSSATAKRSSGAKKSGGSFSSRASRSRSTK